MIQLCIHVANLFYLVSFLVRDMLWLRVLTCCGLLMGMVFFACQPLPMYGPTAWHVVFLVINGAQIRRLVLERRRLRLTHRQERFGAATFHDLSRDEILALLTHVTYEGPAVLTDVRQICHQPLTRDERVLRDLAFSRLSRNELLNLLTRRMWNSLRRSGPAGRGRQRRREPGMEVARGSKTG